MEKTERTFGQDLIASMEEAVAHAEGSGAIGKLHVLDVTDEHQNGRQSTKAHIFEVYKDKVGEFRVRFKYHSEVMFSTEGYANKSSAMNAIKSFVKNGPGAEVVDIS